MAIKKQKRSAKEAELETPRNGPSGKQSKLKNTTAAKTPVPSDNGSLKKKLNKTLVTSEKVKKEVVAIAEIPEQKNAEKKAKLLKKNENRKEARREHGQFKAERVSLNAEEIKKKIEEIQARPEVTKTAKRKVGALKRKLAFLEGRLVSKTPAVDSPFRTESTKRHERRKRTAERKAAELASKGEGAAVVGNFQKKNKSERSVVVKVTEKPTLKNEEKSKAKGQGVKNNKKQIIKNEEPEESDEEDEEEDDEEDEDVEEDEEDEEQDDEDDDEDDDDDEEDEEDDDDEEDDEEDEDDEEHEETVKYALPSGKVKEEIKKTAPIKKEANKKQMEKEPVSNGDSGKKKRFVLFVGNLPFQATSEDIKKHFLTKVSEVKSVRIPTKPGSNLPRGIAYVEVSNETDYQKGLSLHNTNISGRRINVEYTQGGSKSVGNRSEIISKNKKLHAMRKGGMFGGKRDDRNERRKKQKAT